MRYHTLFAFALLPLAAHALDVGTAVSDSLPANVATAELSAASPIPLPSSDIPWGADKPLDNPVIDFVKDFIPNPLAKNWEMQEKNLGQNRYAIFMKMKRFHTGGAGEPYAIFKTRAEALQKSGNFAGYEIESFNEGITSETMGARRVAYGIFALTNPAANAETITWPETKTTPKKSTPRKTPKRPATRPAQTNRVPTQTIDGVQLCLTPCADLLEK